MRRIVGLCFHLLITGSDGAITTPPSNKAVISGTINATMSCTSNISYQIVSWSYLPVGGYSAVSISTGTYVLDAQNYAVQQSGDKQINLIILSATPSRAGTYNCIESSSPSVSAQMIVINSDPLCTTTPNAPTELLYNRAVQMSCSFSYTATSSYVYADMIWSKDGSTTIVFSDPPRSSTSVNVITVVSTITQTPGNSTPFPIFRCNTTINMKGALPSGSATNAPGYSKTTPLSSSPISVTYLKPAAASSIKGAESGRLVQGTTVECQVDGNPPPNYSWFDVEYGNTTNSSTVQIWHNGEYKCTSWNRAASTSVSLNVITYTTTAASTTPTTTTPTNAGNSSRSISPRGSGELSSGDKIGIGVGIGVGTTLVICGILLALLCKRYDWLKRTKTKTDDKRSDGMVDKGPADNSGVPHYEPLNVLSSQDLNPATTYEQLKIATDVDVHVNQQSPDRTTYKNFEKNLNASESTSKNYEGLQQRELASAAQYESINPQQRT